MPPTSPGEQPIATPDTIIATPDIAAVDHSGPDTPFEAAETMVDHALPQPVAQPEAEIALPEGVVVNPVDTTNPSDVNIAANIAAATGNPETPVYAATTPNPEPTPRAEQPAPAPEIIDQVPGISHETPGVRLPAAEPTSATTSYAEEIGRQGAMADAAARTYPTQPPSNVPWGRIESAPANPATLITGMPENLKTTEPAVEPEAVAEPETAPSPAPASEHQIIKRGGNV